MPLTSRSTDHYRGRDPFIPDLPDPSRSPYKLAMGSGESSIRGMLGGKDERHAKPFIDLVVIDSTVIKLHDLLKKAYKACRTNHSQSALKLNVVMSVFGISPRTIRIAFERTSEARLLRIGPWVKGRLLLFDMGYFEYSLFERIERNGGYFISRLKDNANPKILFSHRVHRGI